MVKYYYEDGLAKDYEVVWGYLEMFKKGIIGRMYFFFWKGIFLKFKVGRWGLNVMVESRLVLFSEGFGGREFW